MQFMVIGWWCRGKNATKESDTVKGNLYILKSTGVMFPLKGISADRKTTGPNQLEAIFKKQWFDKSETIPDTRQPTRSRDPSAKVKSAILELLLAMNGSSQKTSPTFNSFPAQKDVPSTVKYTFTIPLVKLVLEIIKLTTFCILNRQQVRQMKIINVLWMRVIFKKRKFFVKLTLNESRLRKLSRVWDLLCHLHQLYTSSLVHSKTSRLHRINQSSKHLLKSS